MPILLVFALTAACLPVPWPESPLGLDRRGSALLTLVVVVLPLAAAFAVRAWVIRGLRRDPFARSNVGHGYARMRRLLFFVNLGVAAVAILGLGWGWAVQQTLVFERDGQTWLAPFAELAVPLPYFAILAGTWIIYYDAERALHRAVPYADPGRPFWSRVGYFAHHLAQFAILLLLPVALFVTQQSFARLFPETVRTDWYRVLSFAALPVLVLLMPLLMKPVLGLRSMPPGPTRDRLELLARRLHFRCTDFLVWRTHGASANAMIVGLVPWVRYVIFTDRILDEMPPDELDGVFGHEVGHAKHGHIWYYVAFLALSMAVLAAGFLLLGQTLDAEGVVIPDEYMAWLALPPVVVAAVYVFIVFGFLSRRCERQADVYGCRAVSCGTPGCIGHDLATVYPPRAAGLCPTGIRTFARALERVGLMNGGGPFDHDRSFVRAVLGWLRAWQHAPLSRRVGFLMNLIDDPSREWRFQWGVRVVRWGLMLGLVAAFVALGRTVGWSELAKVL